jgi:hypothetical protein
MSETETNTALSATTEPKKIDIQTLLSDHRATLTQFEAQAKELAERLAAKQKVIQVSNGFIHFMESMTKTATVSDPGKYGPAMLGFKNGRRALPLELLDEKGVTAAAANHYWVVPFDELDRSQTPCPACGQPKHVKICCHNQTYDSPSGDEWQLDTYVLCPEQSGIFRIDSKRSDCRII